MILPRTVLRSQNTAGSLFRRNHKLQVCRSNCLEMAVQCINNPVSSSQCRVQTAEDFMAELPERLSCRLPPWRRRNRRRGRGFFTSPLGAGPRSQHVRVPFGQREAGAPRSIWLAFATRREETCCSTRPTSSRNGPKDRATDKAFQAAGKVQPHVPSAGWLAWLLQAPRLRRSLLSLPRKYISTRITRLI